MNFKILIRRLGAGATNDERNMFELLCENYIFFLK